MSLIGLNKLTSVNCAQINVFKGGSVYQMIHAGMSLILAIGIWLIGYLLSKKLELGKRNLIIYFIILSAISMNRTIQEIWKSEFSDANTIVESICKKSMDDGMICEFEELTNEEYSFLIRDNEWLPKSPPKAYNINVNYYRDDFLGDYSLNIEIELPLNEVFDTLKYPDWIKTSSQENRENKFIYSQEQS